MYLPEEESGATLPVWAAFGDLMACLLGVFVLLFVWIVSFEVSMAHDLASERAQRRAATDRLATLESALAGPLHAGLITFVNGRIGIRGSVLFDLNSAELRAPGRQLLGEMATPLATYLGSREDALMVSGFTDDLQMRGGPRPYRDNWELSAQRALTVVRALSEAGVPRDALFAAGFGENHPVAPNDTEENRAKNRRVEMAPVPRPRALSIGGAPVLAPASTGSSRVLPPAATGGAPDHPPAATGTAPDHLPAATSGAPSQPGASSAEPPPSQPASAGDALPRAGDSRAQPASAGDALPRAGDARAQPASAADALPRAGDARAQRTASGAD